MAYAYEIIAEEMLNKIISGEWQSGDRLPTLNDLEKQYPQSRMTLYKAMQLLKDRGYINMSRGRGTFVKSSARHQRVAILTSSTWSDESLAPFSKLAFRHAQAYFARLGLASQLYVDDALNDFRIPASFKFELERRRLNGLLTVDATFPARFDQQEEWEKMPIPYVNIGAWHAPYTFYVDHKAFLVMAAEMARKIGKKRVALVERAEHLSLDFDLFCGQCDKQGLEYCPIPSPIPPPTLSYEEYGYELLQRFWRQPRTPQVVIVPDDVIAKGVTIAALALRIEIPHDLTIIAMTNRGGNIFYPVPVVRCEVDVESIAIRGARMLVDLMNGVKAPPQKTFFPPVRPTYQGAINSEEPAPDHP